MKIQRPIIAIALIAWTTLCSSSANNAQQAGSKPSISLSLAASSQQIKIGESTQLMVTLKNVSESEISVGRVGTESDDYDYDVLVVDDKGTEASTTPYYRYLRGKRLPSDPRFLPPSSRIMYPLKVGDVLASKIKLEHLRLLDHVGSYTNWVERVDGISNSRVKSNTVTVTVTP